MTHLSAETGEVEALDLDRAAFLRAAQAEPVEFLSLEPLQQFQREGGALEPGQLLAAYPPFCTKESARGVRLAALPVEERRRFLAEFAAQIREVPEGGTIVLRPEP